MTKTLTVVQTQARNVGQSTVTFGQFDEKGQQIPRTDGVILSLTDKTEAMQFVPGSSYEITIKAKKS